MRWGIRRFQKKDGSLTPAGKKRYDDDSPGTNNKPNEKKKSKHRLKLEESYRKHGLTVKEAEDAADKRIRTEKILAASAAVTVGACALMIANKKRKERIDGIIKSGQSLQRIEMQDTGGKLHDIFYASKDKHDNKRYEGLLGITRIQQTGKAYMLNLEANKDIKVASKDKAVKAFGELYKNDSDFRSAVRDNVSQHFSGQNKVNPDNMSPRNIKKMYDNFNAGLIDIRSSGSGADAKFYSKLKAAGYGAIQDINDMKYSGYRAKNPLIVFDNTNNNIMVKTVKELDKDDTLKKGIREGVKSSFVEPFLEKAGPITAATLTAATVTTYASTPDEIDALDYKHKNRKR